MDVRFEKAGAESLPLIQNILKNNKLVYQDINGANVELFCAYDNTSLVGVIGLEVFDTVALLRSTCVKREYRQKGYGKTLVDKALERAKRLGVKELYLLTNSAKDFFEHIGFETVDRNDVPLSIQLTKEFASYCPLTAACLKIFI